ncbi:MAG: M56 family metallopeptidase [Verrucomicrobiota bacterium]
MTSLESFPPLLFHLLRGLVFLALVFAFAKGWRRFSPRRSSGPASWRLVVLLLGALTLLQLAPAPWRIEIPPPAVSQAEPANFEAVTPAPPAVAPLTLPDPVPPTFAEVAPDTITNKAKTPLTAWQWFFFAWLAGAVLAMSRWLVGRFQLAAWYRKSSVVDSPELQELFSHARKELGIRRSIRLRSNETVPVPLTWGWLRPVVLIPSELSSWPKDSQRMVLLHELSHVAHSDAGYQFLARVLASLHWMNPLAWLAGRELSRQQEEAADRAVISNGLSPSNYARLLVELAEKSPRLAGTDRACIAAVSMARPSSVPHRVEQLLRSRDADSKTTHPWARITTGITFALFALGLAATSFSRAQEVKPQPSLPALPEFEGNSDEGVSKSESIGSVSIRFVETPFSDAIQYLQEISIQHDEASAPEKQGMNFVVLDPDAFEEKTITLELTNVSFQDAVRYTVYLVGGLVTEDGNTLIITGPESAERGSPHPANTDHPKAADIMVPELTFVETPFRDAIQFLQQTSLALDTNSPESQRGFNFVLRDGNRMKPVTLHLRNISLADAISYVVAIGGGAYEISDRTVSIHHADSSKSSPRFMAASVHSLIEGPITRILVEKDQEVKEGEPLLEIDREQEELLAAKAEAVVERAIAERKQAEAALEIEKVNREEMKKTENRLGAHLIANKVAQAEADLTMALSEVEKAVATVKEAEIELELRKLAIERSIVRAPQEGTVSDIRTKGGMPAQPGKTLIYLRVRID